MTMKSKDAIRRVFDTGSVQVGAISNRLNSSSDDCAALAMQR